MEVLEVEMGGGEEEEEEMGKQLGTRVRWEFLSFPLGVEYDGSTLQMTRPFFITSALMAPS